MKKKTKRCPKDCSKRSCHDCAHYVITHIGSFDEGFMFSGHLCNQVSIFNDIWTRGGASAGCPYYDHDADNKKRDAFYKKRNEEAELMWQIEQRTGGKITFDDQGRANLHVPIKFDYHRG